MGAALQQKESGGWRPLAFFSAKLSATHKRYSAFDRELLRVFHALRHFRFELEGRKFHILTDHLPLVSALSCVSPPWSVRQQRQLSYISEFTSDLRHTPGAANVVADNLSLPPQKSPPAPQLPPSPGVMLSEDSCSLAYFEKLITEEVGKADVVVETDTSDTSNTADTSDTSDTADTSDTLTPGEGGSCGAGGDFGGGRERLSTTTFAAPGVWWRSLVNSVTACGTFPPCHWTEGGRLWWSCA